MVTRRQHYVWRHYLEAWQDRDNLVHGARRGQLIPPTNPINLLVERDFYRIPILTETHRAHLYSFAQASNTYLRQVHYDFIDKILHISAANEKIQRSENISPEDKATAQAAVIEVEEQLHSQIESDAFPFLDMLRQNNIGFISDDQKAIPFFHFIGQQYFRTRHMRDAITIELAADSAIDDLSPLANVMCHMAGVNLGGSLFRDRRNLDILLLSDRDGVGFITGDQPVVNVLGTGDRAEVTELLLYYPLSPTLACLIAPKEYRWCSGAIDVVTVELLNRVIVCESNEWWIANSDEVLIRLLGNAPIGRPDSRLIIEGLTDQS